MPSFHAKNYHHYESSKENTAVTPRSDSIKAMKITVILKTFEEEKLLIFLI